MAASSFPIYAIIVAGGAGSRMQSAVPKQFLPLAGLPVLMHTLRRFAEYSASMQIVLVLPEQEMTTWSALCHQHNFQIPHQLVAGGKTRFQSVRKGLEALAAVQEGVVAVHDGVRPFVDAAILEAAFGTAFDKGACVVAVPLKDSVRRITGNTSRAVDRNAYRLVQTPQCFRLPLLRKAYEQPESPLFTDDASVVERFGHKVHLVEGSYKNIKITTQEDMLVAEAFLKADS